MTQFKLTNKAVEDLSKYGIIRLKFGQKDKQINIMNHLSQTAKKLQKIQI